MTHCWLFRLYAGHDQRSPVIRPSSDLLPMWSLFILLLLTSSFAAVMITMPTRGRPNKKSKIWVVVSCFQSRHIRLFFRRGRAELILRLFPSVHTSTLCKITTKEISIHWLTNTKKIQSKRKQRKHLPQNDVPPEKALVKSKVRV